MRKVRFCVLCILVCVVSTASPRASSTSARQRGIDSVEFTGSGPGQFDLEWQPDTNTWLPLFAEGRFDVMTPTPEPTTLLLFATTGAGFGLARWLRRRSGDREQLTGRPKTFGVPTAES